MEANHSDDNVALWGRPAVKWLFGHKEGGAFFDRALTGVTAVFGAEATVSAFAPLNVRFEPTDFFLQVEGSPENDEDWLRLVAAHEMLIRQGSSRLRRPPRYENLHLVLDVHLIAPVPVGSAQEAWL
ncbi:MAG: hypothetical protein ACTHNY_07815 [Solirubrobacterales bacterium]